MAVVMAPTCRSYSTLQFDGCTACVDAALDAVGQAGMYILGRTAPEMAPPSHEPLEMAYQLRLKLHDEFGTQIGLDELEAEQTIQPVDAADEDDEFDENPFDTADEDDTDAHEGSMRLEDFQTVLDRVELSPAGRQGLCGTISGHLYAFERLVGPFEIAVTPTR